MQTTLKCFPFILVKCNQGGRSRGSLGREDNQWVFLAGTCVICEKAWNMLWHACFVLKLQDLCSIAESSCDELLTRPGQNPFSHLNYILTSTTHILLPKWPAIYHTLSVVDSTSICIPFSSNVALRYFVQQSCSIYFIQCQCADNISMTL